jgi:hypothetical protein
MPFYASHFFLQRVTLPITGQVNRAVRANMGLMLRLHNTPISQCCHAAIAWLAVMNFS